MSLDIFRDRQAMTQAYGRLSRADRLNALAVTLARILYLGEEGPDAPPFDTLSEAAQEPWLEHARAGQRMVARTPLIVGVEYMAQAMAHEQGWSWPDLIGYPARIAPGTPGDVANATVQLTRIEARQRLRHLAHRAANVLLRHLRAGNARDRAAAERQVLIDATRLEAAERQDAADRARLIEARGATPPERPVFTLLNGGRP